MTMGKSSPAPVASLVGVGLRYGKTVALDGITLDIPAGRMVGLLGPDGVGKSSLLALLAGARKVQSGRVEVLGGDMAGATSDPPSRPLPPSLAAEPPAPPLRLPPDEPNAGQRPWVDHLGGRAMGHPAHSQGQQAVRNPRRGRRG